MDVPITGSKKKKKVKVRKADRRNEDLESPLMFMNKNKKDNSLEFDKDEP